MELTEVAIGRTRALIDRALDTGNRRRFAELCALLRTQQAIARRPARQNQGSKA